MAATIPLLRSQLSWQQQQHTVETMPTGVASFDAILGGCPRGRITEICGSASSGRTSLLHRILAAASERGEFTAVVDTTDAFDPVTAAAARVDLNSLVWIRCGGNIEHAFKAADLLVSAGGFGVVALDLCNVPKNHTHRIPLSYWFRFQKAVEKSPAIFLVMSQEPLAKSTSALTAEVAREEVHFSGRPPVQLLDSARFCVSARRPFRAEHGEFAAQAVGY